MIKKTLMLIMLDLFFLLENRRILRLEYDHVSVNTR